MVIVELASAQPKLERVRIKIIGVGGGGGNAINNMIETGMKGVTFIAANTDEQVLSTNKAQVKIQLGPNLTGGKGAGGDPNIGQEAAKEVEEAIREALKNTDMLFITSTMGGGTGTGASPIIAKIAKEMDILVVAIVTKPFTFEGKMKENIAEKGISELKQYVDALIILPNDKLIDIANNKLPYRQAFLMIDEVLYQAASGISDMIVNEGFMNIDFADVKAVMQYKGDAIMSIGIGSGENRANEAAENAMNSKFLDGAPLSGAKGILLNFTCSEDLTLPEIQSAIEIIKKLVNKEAFFKYGIINKPELKDTLQITLIATGLNYHQDTSSYESTKTNPPKTPKPESLFPNQRDIISNSTGMGGRIPIIRNNTLDRSEAQTTIAQSPSGFSELKKFEQPTYERKGMVISAPNNIIPNNTLNPNSKDENISDYPAFLRKRID